MRTGSTKPLILVVDDDESILDFVHRNLARFGIETLLASSGDEGLSTFINNQSTIDAILTDVNCDKGSSYDGPWMVEAIRKSGYTLPPTKFMTGDTTGNNMERLMRLSGNTVLAKPFMPHELMVEINVLVPQHMSDVATVSSKVA